MPESDTAGAVTVPALRTILKDQYHACLTMLKSAIEQCPDDLWVSTEYTNPYWRVVYHTLYFVHLYSRTHAAGFVAWDKHQTGIQDMDDMPAPPDIQELTEPAHRPPSGEDLRPQTGKPYSKQEMLEYWQVCDDMVDESIDALDLTSADSGFSWYPISKLEHQIVAIRHIAHHTAQLSDRLRSAIDAGVDWVGRRR